MAEHTPPQHHYGHHLIHHGRAYPSPNTTTDTISYIMVEHTPPPTPLQAPSHTSWQSIPLPNPIWYIMGEHTPPPTPLQAPSHTSWQSIPLPKTISYIMAEHTPPPTPLRTPSHTSWQSIPLPQHHYRYHLIHHGRAHTSPNTTTGTISYIMAEHTPPPTPLRTPSHTSWQSIPLPQHHYGHHLIHHGRAHTSPNTTTDTISYIMAEHTPPPTPLRTPSHTSWQSTHLPQHHYGHHLIHHGRAHTSPNTTTGTISYIMAAVFKIMTSMGCMQNKHRHHHRLPLIVTNTACIRSASSGMYKVSDTNQLYRLLTTCLTKADLYGNMEIVLHLTDLSIFNVFWCGASITYIHIYVYIITCTSGRCNRQSKFTLLHFTIFQWFCVLLLRYLDNNLN